jgi:hypothetical protein
MGWYSDIMPTVGDLEPLVVASAESIYKLPGVSSVRAWGSYAENAQKKTARIREVEILVKCSFNSGDLLAIEKGPMGPFNIHPNDLEDLGFNPKAVKFTKGLLKSCSFRSDLWTYSSDKKLLHWGPVADTIEEWKEVRKQSEEIAEKRTGFCRKTLKKASEEEAKEWVQSYEESLQSFISEGPLGWYESACSETREIIDSSIEIKKG